MWLLSYDAQNHQSIKLTQYVGTTQLPPYAILSHTWGPESEEVNFEDVSERRGEGKSGWMKVRFCLAKAAEDGIHFCWIDTCCIRRQHPTELSEAINSMFQWYQNATKCLVYLSHIPPKNFKYSRWFERGWTLQELIAPKIVEFFSSEGIRLGDKSSLAQKIHEITQVPVAILQGRPLNQYSTREKMSWTTGRETKREEDMVYSMLGIFGVSIPLIYGEGRARAESRLLFEVTRRLDFDKAVPSGEGIKEPGSELQKGLMRSLKFIEIEARQLTIQQAHPNTGRWLLYAPQYVTWMDDTKFDEHRGLLWIKGKPGSGKSTLMKFALTNASRTIRDTIALSFFFNSRGSKLEKSTTGAYRTLLVQLLTYLPDPQSVLEFLRPIGWVIGDDYQWDLRTLKALLRQSFQRLGKRCVMLFIDALDECEEQEIRDMITYFEDMNRPGGLLTGRIRICLASRHYPYITIRSGLNLMLDQKEGHTQDISNFLQTKLQIGRSKLADDLRDELLIKSSGIFLWTVIFVYILNQEYDNGQMHRIRRRLTEIPSDIFYFFRDILTRDSTNKDGTLACIQWILFAKNPLEPKALYFAIRFSIEGMPLSQLELQQMSTDAMEKYVLYMSKGLAEITRSETPSVQFIHESVRDFLLREGGLSAIWPRSAENTRGWCEERLAECCRGHLHIELGSSWAQLIDLPTSHSAEATTLRKLITKEFPFLEYAVKNIFYHAEKAAECGIMGSFLSEFESRSLQMWIKLANAFAKPGAHKYSSSQSLMYILCHQNCTNLLSYELRKKRNAQQGLVYDDMLSTAIDQNHKDVVQILLNDKSVIKQLTRSRIAATLVMEAIQRKRWDILKLLYDKISTIDKEFNKSILSGFPMRTTLPSQLRVTETLLPLKKLVQSLLDMGGNLGSLSRDLEWFPDTNNILKRAPDDNKDMSDTEPSATQSGAQEIGYLRISQTGPTNHFAEKARQNLRRAIERGPSIRDTITTQASPSQHQAGNETLINQSQSIYPQPIRNNGLTTRNDSFGTEVAADILVQYPMDPDETDIQSLVDFRQTSQSGIEDSNFCDALCQQKDLAFLCTEVSHFSLHMKPIFLQNVTKALKRLYLRHQERNAKGAEQGGVLPSLASRRRRSKIAMRIYDRLTSLERLITIHESHSDMEEQDLIGNKKSLSITSDALVDDEESRSTTSDTFLEDEQDRRTYVYQNNSDEEMPIEHSDLVAESANSSKMYQVLAESGELNKFLIDLCLMFLPSHLRYVIENIPVARTELLDQARWSALESVKSFIKGKVGHEWTWGPWNAPPPPLNLDQKRLIIHCHCGQTLTRDVPVRTAKVLEIIIRLRQSLELSTIISPNLAWGGLIRFLNPLQSSSSSTAQPSAIGQRYVPATVLNQQSQFSPNTGQSSSTGRVLTSLIHNQSQSTSHNDLWLVLGHQGSRPILEIEHIKISDQKGDLDCCSELKAQYTRHRGRWKRWFSIWQLSSCQFVKFDKIRGGVIIHQPNKWPEKHPDYELEPPFPSDGPPPINESTFQTFLSLCDSAATTGPRYCSWNIFHQCMVGYFGDSRWLIQRVPKKRHREFNYQSDGGEEEAWGLHPVLATSLPHMIYYHLFIIMGPLVFWWVWLWGHPNDLQTAAVPLTLAIGLVSMFWGAKDAFSK